MCSLFGACLHDVLTYWEPYHNFYFFHYKKKFLHLFLFLSLSPLYLVYHNILINLNYIYYLYIKMCAK